MKDNVKLFFALLLLLALISISYFTGTSSQSFFNQTIYLIFPMIAALAGFLAAKIYGYRDKAGRGIFYMAIGFAFWALGDITWYLFVNFMNIDPFPSIADVFYVSGYLLVFIGICVAFMLAKINPADIKKIAKRSLTVNIPVLIVLISIVSYFGIYKAYDPGSNFIHNFFSLSYGIVDLVLIIASMFALAIMKIYQGGKFAAFWRDMLIGFLLFLLADILFALYQAEYTKDLKPYIYIDLIYAASYLCFAFAMFDRYISLLSLHRSIKNGISK